MRLKLAVTALALSLAVASCGTAGESLETPDSLAMVEETSTTDVEESETTTSSSDEAPKADDPADAQDPTTVPMTTPAVTDPPATNTPATDPPPTETSSDPPAGADALVQAEGESFNLLNELRASLGLGQLTRTGEMDSFARSWSQTMATSGNFEHSTGPYGENIAWNSQGSLTPADAAAAMHDMWINSPDHYANMTNPDYSLAGIGFYQDSSGWHATHVFDR